MTSEKIREACKAQPFRPFRLHLGSGRVLNVRHPEFVAVSPSGRTAAIYGPRDELEIIDILMVQSIEYRRNGRRGGRTHSKGPH